MKAPRAAAAVALLHLAAAAAQPPTGIPTHPRDLRFSEPRFAPPAAATRRHALAGGAVAYVEEDPTLPLVQIAVALRVGSFLDPPGKIGLASLTGLMLRRGGTESLAADQLDERIDFLGARLDSWTGTVRGGASLDVPSRLLPQALDLLFEVLARPRFQEDRLETARRNLREHLARRNEEPLDVLQREWEWLIFGHDHFSTRPVTGATLEAIERRDLLEFHRRWWRPPALVFAVSGDVRPEEIVPLLEAGLARWPEAGPAPPAPWPPPAPTHRPRPGLYLAEHATPQAKVRLGHRAAPEKPWSRRQRAAVELMSEILGGSGAISRVAGRLRTAEGIVYRASAGIDAGELWPGDFGVFFETRGDQVARATGLAVREIRRLRDAAVHPTELETARQSLLASIRERFDTAEKRAGFLAENELLGRPEDWWPALYEELRGIGADEVREAARWELRPEELVVLVVGRGRELGIGTDDAPGELERAVGLPLIRLPARDPLSMVPLEAH